MSADVIILPVIRTETVHDANDVRARLSDIDYGRLKRVAAGWSMTIEEAASAVLSGALKPPGAHR